MTIQGQKEYALVQLLKNKPVTSQIKRLSQGESNVVDFYLTKSKSFMQIREACDGHFSQELSKDEFGYLIYELQLLHSQMN